MVKVMKPIALQVTPLHENFSALLARNGGPFQSQKELGRACGADAAVQKTIDRVIKEADYSFAYDSLDKIAIGFKVPPWMLLIPGFDPTSRQHVAFWVSTLDLWDRAAQKKGR